MGASTRVGDERKRSQHVQFSIFLQFGCVDSVIALQHPNGVGIFRLCTTKMPRSVAAETSNEAPNDSVTESFASAQIRQLQYTDSMYYQLLVLTSRLGPAVRLVILNTKEEADGKLRIVQK